MGSVPETGLVDEQCSQVLDAAVEALDHGIDLDAVARGEHGRPR
ncbi:MAG: hypothetical protein WKF73_16800 [Nocardioidaceae bacterium]